MVLDFSLFGTSIDAGLGHSILFHLLQISSLIRECLRCVETSTSWFTDISTDLTPQHSPAHGCWLSYQPESFLCKERISLVVPEYCVTEWPHPLSLGFRSC